MSHNSFGHLFRVTTFGESHGPALGCVVDGCPPMLPLEAADIQAFLDKRRPGQSRFTTQRQEPDAVRILSGVFLDEAASPSAEKLTVRQREVLQLLAEGKLMKEEQVVSLLSEANEIAAIMAASRKTMARHR